MFLEGMGEKLNNKFWFCFGFCFFETGACCVAQATLKNQIYLGICWHKSLGFTGMYLFCLNLISGFRTSFGADLYGCFEGEGSWYKQFFISFRRWDW